MEVDSDKAKPLLYIHAFMDTKAVMDDKVDMSSHTQWYSTNLLAEVGLSFWKGALLGNN